MPIRLVLLPVSPTSRSGRAFRPADRDQAVPVRVVPDADEAPVELRLPLPVIDHVGPVLDVAVGRPDEPRVLLVHLVEPVALLRVD